MYMETMLYSEENENNSHNINNTQKNIIEM